MGRPFFAQLFTKPGPGSAGDDGKRQRRERAAARAVQAGPPGLAERLNPLQTSDWGVERQRRQKQAKDQYFRDKQRLLVQERRAREQLKKQMEARKREIDNYYRVNSLAATDPRLDSVSRKAQRRFARYEKKVQRKHHQQWLKSFRRRKGQRDKQYRQITKAMKKEHRRSRGLPDEMQAPWNV